MFQNISFKLIFAVGLAAILIISIFAYLNVRSQQQVLLAEVERHSNQLSETVKSSTRYDMLLNNRPHILKIVQQIGDDPSIKDIRIMNKEGSITYSADTSQIGHILDKKAQACYVCHAENQPLEKLPISNRTRVFRVHPDSSRVFGIINPIYNEPSCWTSDCHAHSRTQTVLGVLDVVISLKNIDAQIASAKFKMLLLAVIAIMALSGIIWFFVKNWVDKPVNALVTATRQVASGNLNYSIENVSSDELGVLARSFNNMTQKLSEARLQLVQSDKMASLGRLAAGVAHEINNPLTGILTYSSFLLKRAKDNPELKEDLEVIVRETKRSREIVKGLLDFARQSVPKKTKVDIREVLERALHVIENQLSLKQVKIVKQFENDLPRITADANQVQQVFINLIENGADAMGERGGTITLTAAAIQLAPFGILQVKKAACPKGHDLIDPAFKIDGLPSIRLKAASNGEEGFIHLHPVYGKPAHHYGIAIHRKSKFTLSCPRCNISLLEEGKTCPSCGSAVYALEVPSQGKLAGCTNKDCAWQYWETAEREGKKEYVEIKVADSGCGISRENLEKIFEPFFSTKGQKGTGLGLAVVWGIIDNHSGTISVDSEVGRGTTFTLRLPAEKG